MQTPNIQFGKVYEIRSRAFDAPERAEQLVAEKLAQGIDAEMDQPSVVFPEENGMDAWVYTNEGDDNALDVFNRQLKAKEDCAKILEQEFSYMLEEPEDEVSREQNRQHLRDNMKRFQDLISGGDEARAARRELAELIKNATPLHFNEQGEQVDHVNRIW